MVFGKKKVKYDVEKMATVLMEIEDRFNNLVGILQESCPALKNYLDKEQRTQVQPQVVSEHIPPRAQVVVKVPEPETREEELEEIKRIVEGKPSKKAKEVLRL